jgi:Fic-DOC domain mobile mystery protein B
MDFRYAPGATPLDVDEAAALIPTHIATQGDLDAWEEANILQGARWAARQKKRDLLDEGFVRDLHRQMFGKTWRWAGIFRSSDKNIGVEWAQVSVRVRNLMDDTRYQIENKAFGVDELAVRFHHRLVWIHPFPNGNGRHARLMADMLAMRLGVRVFPGAEYRWCRATRSARTISTRCAPPTKVNSMRCCISRGIRCYAARFVSS